MPDDRKNPRPWTKMLDTYPLMQRQVDVQVGLVLEALAQSPFADKTIVVFAFDHGEYGGAHGMRGKGFAFYDEGLNVPLIVKDPTGGWTKQKRLDRRQLVESVDLAALMLTLGTGGDDWRGNSTYAQIAGRADIAAILTTPTAKGRPTSPTRPTSPARAAQLPTAQQIRPAPYHITAVRTQRGKFARYALWKEGTTESTSPSRSSTRRTTTPGDGRIELDNVYAGAAPGPDDRRSSAASTGCSTRRWRTRSRRRCPPRCGPAQDQAFTDWFAQPPATFTPATDN